jgi:Fe-S oxidoreductase
MRMVTVGTDPEELHEQAVAAQRCLTCALCEVRCPQGVHISEFARGLRSLDLDGDRQPCPHGRVIQVAASPDWIGRVLPAELSWLEDDLEVAEHGEIALFVGCLPIFDALFGERFGVRTTDIARAAIRTLNALGIKPVVAADERCCGHDLLWGGDKVGFTALAEANAAVFADRGVELVLTVCAECCRTWRLDYIEAVPHYQPRVQHFVEFIDERLDTGELSFVASGSPETVTYQDPCRLGRHLGVVDAPRRVLAAMPEVDLVEMADHGADARCCGTAGFIHCDAASRRLQRERLDAASTTEAATLLTACPKCLIHFACAQEEDDRNGAGAGHISVEDLTVFTTRLLAAPVPADETKERTETVT